jgi:hypothetical protein
MGIKEVVHKLGNQHDFPILLTEELHQVFVIQGYKRKNLAELLNAFGSLSYVLEITFPATHPEEWKLTDAGKLQAHVRLPATIYLRLVPSTREGLFSEGHGQGDEKEKEACTTDMAIKRGMAYLKQKANKLYETFPDDAAAICEYLGRLAPYYKNFYSWQWFLCPRSGTTINFHLEPCGIVNPAFFLNAQQLCKNARISNINVYPYTVEIVFHAFSQIENLPYNRRHRARFKPY